MKIQSKQNRLPWLTLPFGMLVLVLPNIGCISIRNSSPNCFPVVANCNHIQPELANSAEFCPLYDRRDVLRQWAGKLNPKRLIPGQVTDWTSNQRSRCVAARTSVQSWICTKKEEANAPPWPRFHPVPTKPVFEPEENDTSTAPDVYGQFGKG